MEDITYTGTTFEKQVGECLLCWKKDIWIANRDWMAYRYTWCRCDEIDIGEYIDLLKERYLVNKRNHEHSR